MKLGSNMIYHWLKVTEFLTGNKNNFTLFLFETRRTMGTSVDLKKPSSTFSMLNFANSPVLDENGASIKLSSLWQKQTTMFIFLRHFGCVSCRAHAKQVWSEREKYESKGSKIIFVGNGTPYFITKFKEDLGLQEATIYTDPTLQSFYAAGFKRGFVASLGPRALFNGIKMLANGHSQGAYDKDSGNLWQLGGIVVVKPTGDLAFHYISQVMGDYPPEKDISQLD